jgi:4-alpha-glucanotransferase
MNTPSRLGDNWQWRAAPGAASAELAARIRALTDVYGRLA